MRKMIIPRRERKRRWKRSFTRTHAHTAHTHTMNEIYEHFWNTSLAQLAYKVSNKKRSHSNSISVFGIWIHFSLASTHAHICKWIWVCGGYASYACSFLYHLVCSRMLWMLHVIVFAFDINFSLFLRTVFTFHLPVKYYLLPRNDTISIPKLVR